MVIQKVEGFQKMSRAYDVLMKSGKFTAAQNKGESGEFIDSIGELVAICEEQGFIPKYYVDEPRDKVDRVLQDYQKYVKQLITEETNLNNLIETSVKNMRKEQEKIDNAANNSVDDDENLFEEQIFNEEIEEISDDAFVELKDMIQEELGDN